MSVESPDILKERKSHIFVREENEHYVEPRWCSARLFEVEGFGGSIWDPACGFGNIPESARAAGHQIVIASDIVDRGYPATVVCDFLTETEQVAQNIVTNPPFDIASEFAKHALRRAHKKVAIVFPTARLNAAHWARTLPLVRVWLMTPRPSMPPGHVIARGEKPGGGKMDFCWLVFLHGFTGLPELRWLRRDKAVA